MIKKILALTCLTLSIGANAATYTYTSNNYEQIETLLGTNLYDTINLTCVIQS